MKKTFYGEPTEDEFSEAISYNAETNNIAQQVKQLKLAKALKKVYNSKNNK